MKSKMREVSRRTRRTCDLRPLVLTMMFAMPLLAPEGAGGAEDEDDEDALIPLSPPV
jgi:hypothetical protein